MHGIDQHENIVIKRELDLTKNKSLDRVLVNKKKTSCLALL